MTYPTQLSEKVTPQRLDTMYGNFVKITDWLLKGKQSQYAMPAPFAALFSAVDLVQAQQQSIAEQNNVIGSLQQRLAQQDGRIAALENTLQAVNTTLAQLVELANAQALKESAQAETPAPQTPPSAPEQAPAVVSEPAPEPVAQSAPVTEELPELPDLGAIEQAPVQPAVSPNEQAIQVTAAAIGAGNIDPASYAALDAEIGALLS